MKKFLSILLAVVCALSIFVVPGQAAEPSSVQTSMIAELPSGKKPTTQVPWKYSKTEGKQKFDTALAT